MVLEIQRGEAVAVMGAVGSGKALAASWAR